MTAIFSASDFLHPLDLAARQQLESLPLLKPAVKKYLDVVADRRQRQVFLSNAVRLGPRQLPSIYRMLPPICAAFGIPEPELYLIRGDANAAAVGHTKTMIVIHNELLEDLKEEEVRAVLAHECGHILAQHVLYRQMAIAMLNLGGHAGILGATAGALANLGSIPLQMAMLDWYRKSELTADRAAVAYIGSPEPLQRALFRLIGVPQWMTNDVSYEEFAEQAIEFDLVTDSSKWDRYLARNLERGSTHPIPTVRIRELMVWSQTEAYRQLLSIAHQEGLQDRPMCSECGQQLESDWRFCQRCGQEIVDLRSDGTHSADEGEGVRLP